MKNKHLLLIFACTLLLGFVARYAPWFKSDLFNTDLVHLDSTRIERISIVLPGQTELLLEHSEEGWVASQDDFAIRTADSLLAPILASLAEIRSLRILHTTRRDTLLLLPMQAVHVEVFMKNGGKEQFEIGREILENKAPATFIEIDRHDGIYLTDKYLRRVFMRHIDDFRSKTVWNSLPENVRTIQIARTGLDSLFFQKSDTTAGWKGNRVVEELLQEQVQQWLQRLTKIDSLPFGRHADERLAADRLVATVALGSLQEEEPVSLQFFALGNHTVSADGKTFQRMAPAYLLLSSKNPFNFFVLSDTALARNIFMGPRQQGGL